MRHPLKKKRIKNATSIVVTQIEFLNIAQLKNIMRFYHKNKNSRTNVLICLFNLCDKYNISQIIKFVKVLLNITSLLFFV